MQINKDIGAPKPWVTYKRLFSSVANYKKVFIFAVVGVLIASAAEAVIYKFIAPALFDQGVIAHNSAFLARAPWYILGTFLLRGIGDGIGKYCMAYVGRSTVRDQRVRMLNHMLYLPIAFFEQTTTGALISKVNYDAEQVAQALTDAVLELFKGLVTMVFLIGVMLSISWPLTLIIGVVAPIIATYLKYISKRVRKYSSKVQYTMANVTQVTAEVVESPRVIRVFQGGEFEKGRIAAVTENNRSQEIKVALMMALSEPIMQFIGAVVLAIFVYLATLREIHITPGEFIGLFAAMFGLIRPIKQITQVNNVLQRGIAAAQSIHHLLDMPPESDAGTEVLTKVAGEIAFSGVSFSYRQGQDEPVLKDISFVAKSGETIAVVGSSGGGKTTLVSLLPRFYNCQQGQILLDGQDIKTIKLDSLRQNISIVMQDIVLFNDSVANNIAYGGKQGATRDQIIAAATAANAMNFIEQLPQGLDTNIGQNGVLLSGGQRQRLAIARAILKNAPILILDEATSNLDTESERYIQGALLNLIKERTTFVIAHRLSTIEQADKILVLEHGEIVEFGTPQDLMQYSSRYSALQQMQ